MKKQRTLMRHLERKSEKREEKSCGSCPSERQQSDTRERVDLERGRVPMRNHVEHSHGVLVRMRWIPLCQLRGPQN
jgi:hypothetical protein